MAAKARLPPLLQQLRALPVASLHNPPPPARNVQRQQSPSRSYYSREHPEPGPFPVTEASILSASLAHVPAHGFSETALQLGARDAGYLPASLSLFPRGAFDLINYYMVIQRLALRDHVQFPDEDVNLTARVRTLVLERLRANRDIIHQWQDAVSLMALPSNVPPAIAELAALADEIWYLAGDMSVDPSWYTKRASLSAIYSATEMFMTQDTSDDYADTEVFLDRRLEDAASVGALVRDVKDWVSFQGAGLINMLRSKGVMM